MGEGIEAPLAKGTEEVLPFIKPFKPLALPEPTKVEKSPLLLVPGDWLA